MADMDISKYRVKPDTKVNLKAWATDGKDGLEKEPAKLATAELNLELEALQELLYAHDKERVLVVIQATDTGGKDGTIRHVFDRTNPAGVKVASFKKPSEEELARDYLWRIHKHVPDNGTMTIFNRSHYEDVLVVRVHDLVPEDRWSKRYRHINEFERMLADEGTTIIKLFLHLSRAEQKERLQARLDEPDKNWKFAVGDLKEREHWDQYQEAFTEMLAQTSTAWAPWYVIPADRKWFRNHLVSNILVDHLKGLDMSYPQAEEDLTNIVIPD